MADAVPLLSAYLGAAWDVLLELAPWLLLGAAVAGVLHVALPTGLIRQRLRGRRGVVTAVLLGVPLPLCSCGVIPAGLGLRRDGASRGAAVGFLIATPQTGVDSLLVSASFLGWPFALFKVASALVLGLVGGLATEALGDDEETPAIPPVGAERAKRTWSAGIEHALETVRPIWGWLVFGVLVSAALTVLVPPEAFEGLSAAGGLATMAAMLLVSVPLYVCATASVPIAAALVAGGFPLGAALVFLMAGPATNVATLGAVRRAFGGRVVAVYLSTIVVGSLALAWAFDFVLVGGLGVAAAHGHHGASPVAVLSALLLLGLVGAFATQDLAAALRRRRQGGAPPGPVLEVPIVGMTCDGCVRAVERRLSTAPGGARVEVVREPHGRARVEGDVDEATIRDAVRDAGYTPA
ncbi:MAG: permease [Sandaracinaceae bacterium]